MLTRYLGEQVERLSSVANIKGNRAYILGYGKQAFKAFVAPTDGSGKEVTFDGLKIYEAHLTHDGRDIAKDSDAEKVFVGDLTIDDFIDVEFLGLFLVKDDNGLSTRIRAKIAGPVTRSK